MAKNLRKGSKVFVMTNGRSIPGIVKKRFTVRKGSVNVDPKDKEARTLVHVKAAGNIFSKRPSELKRRK